VEALSLRFDACFAFEFSQRIIHSEKHAFKKMCFEFWKSGFELNILYCIMIIFFVCLQVTNLFAVEQFRICELNFMTSEAPGISFQDLGKFLK